MITVPRRVDQLWEQQRLLFLEEANWASEHTQHRPEHDHLQFAQPQLIPRGPSGSQAAPLLPGSTAGSVSNPLSLSLSGDMFLKLMQNPFDAASPETSDLIPSVLVSQKKAQEITFLTIVCVKTF